MEADTVAAAAAAAPVEVVQTQAPLTAAQLMEEHDRAAVAAAAAAENEASAEQVAAGVATATVNSDAATPVPAAAATTKAKKPKTGILDVNSAEAFPALGRGPAAQKPAATARPLWGSNMPAVISAPGLATNGATTAWKAGFKPMGQIRNETTSILELQEHEKIPKNQLRRGMADIGKDVEKKTGTRIQMSTTSAGVTVVIIKGRPVDVSVARRELMRELCPKVCRFGEVGWVLWMDANV